MARKLNRRFVLAGAVTVSGPADAEAIRAAAEALSSSLVVPLEDHEPMPRNVREAETLCEDGRLSSSDRTKSRALLTELKRKGDSR